jgi:hypothetical protein
MLPFLKAGMKGLRGYGLRDWRHCALVAIH